MIPLSAGAAAGDRVDGLAAVRAMEDATEGVRLGAVQAPVLVLNAGSTGLKASLHGADGACLWREQRTWEELGARSGLGGSGQGFGPLALQAIPGVASGSAPGLPPQLDQALAAWLDGGLAPARLALVGHRVVHGGERFTAPTLLEEPALQALTALNPLPPLHNPPALALIHWAQAHWPAVPQWACFDTAFHATLPPEARTYAIPAAWRQDGLRRYGFHGLNHQHVAEVVAQRSGAFGLGGAGRLISCHLGGGCSLCAIRGGRSLATTMGFTPLEGLVMASRSGSVDPGLLLHQLRRGLGPAELERALVQEGGLLGLSELSGSMEVLRAAALPAPHGAGHGGAALAIAVFRQRLLEGIGAMAASLGGVDLIALTGGIGEHDQALRQELAQALAWLGPPELVVIPADEEGVIARSCRQAAQGKG